MQTLIFGYALDTQIEHIPTVVLNLDGRESSRRFIDQMVNTQIFDIETRAVDDDTFRHELTSGRAKVGITVPPDFTERLLAGRQTYVQVLIDGSDSSVATSALNSANLLGIRKSIEDAEEKRVAEAIAFAEASTFPEDKEIYDHVFAS